VIRSIVICVLFSLSGSLCAAEPLTLDRLALRILDSEALYTTTGLKPISDGFWQTRFPANESTSPDLKAARKLLRELPLGEDLEADVLIFATAYENRKSASAFLAHKPSLRGLIDRRRDVFEPLGVTTASTPRAVMEAIDRSPRSARWRAFGLVFGYPEHAIEFFVTAGETQDRTQKFVERDFLQLPTFASDQGRFVYAVPKGHVLRIEDLALQNTTAEQFARYSAWRQVYQDRERLPASTLLRRWIQPNSLCEIRR
jgi:hypothetical protein